MLPRSSFIQLIVVVLFSYFIVELHAADAPRDPHTVWGVVLEGQSGSPDVVVGLCDAQTGLPLTKQTYEPMQWFKAKGVKKVSDQMAIVLSDDRGYFRFEHVPDGCYRLVAQRWSGAFKGVFEKHGTVIQLMGTADDIVVPRPMEYHKALIGLRSPGKRLVEFDQQVGNSETFMFLSTAKPTFDPVLGLYAMGMDFLQNIIGVNRMPYGKTTIVGAPDDAFFAFLIAPDNQAGFVSLKVPASKTRYVGVPFEPFVASWSDGRKTPPADLAELMLLWDQEGGKLKQLYDPEKLRSKSFMSLVMELEKPVELPEVIRSKLTWQRSVRVGDLLAIQGYRNLQLFEMMRREQKNAMNRRDSLR